MHVPAKSNEEVLQELLDVCRAHDRLAEYSDDHGVWLRWNNERMKMHELKATLYTRGLAHQAEEILERYKCFSSN